MMDHRHNKSIMGLFLIIFKNFNYIVNIYFKYKFKFILIFIFKKRLFD